MKLVEIKDIREGQIYERSRCIFVVMRRSGIDSVVLRLYCHNRKPEPNNAYEAEECTRSELTRSMIASLSAS